MPPKLFNQPFAGQSECNGSNRCDQESSATGRMSFSKDVYEDWICGIFTKTVCEAKNRNNLLKAKAMAEELGLEEGKDFFLIRGPLSHGAGAGGSG